MTAEIRPAAVFFDTEFSSLDVNFRELISVGMVAENSDDRLYIVITEGWQSAGVSTFTRDVVVPLLGKHNPEYLHRAGAAARIEEWLNGLRGDDRSVPIRLMSDSPIDWQLLLGLFEPDWEIAENVEWKLIQQLLQESNMQPEFDQAFEEFFLRRAHSMRQRGGEQHHALVDAIAIKNAFKIANKGV